MQRDRGKGGRVQAALPRWREGQSSGSANMGYADQPRLAHLLQRLVQRASPDCDTGSLCAPPYCSAPPARFLLQTPMPYLLSVTCSIRHLLYVTRSSPRALSATCSLRHLLSVTRAPSSARSSACSPAPAGSAPATHGCQRIGRPGCPARSSSCRHRPGQHVFMPAHTVSGASGSRLSRRPFSGAVFHSTCRHPFTQQQSEAVGKVNGDDMGWVLRHCEGGIFS